jgi:AraC-like DNA-binding protein
MKKIFFLFFMLISGSSIAQDTVFVKSHDLDYIRNIDALQSKLLIRYDNSYQFYEKGNFLKKTELSTKTEAYTWADNLSHTDKIFHSDYIPVNKLTKDLSRFSTMVPGDKTYNITYARINDAFYLCWKGKLLEYKIYENYKRILPQASIRHFFSNNSSVIISTYSGTYVYDKALRLIKKYNNPYYSNGEINVINSKFYQCSDDLYQITKDTMLLAWQRNGTDKFRKLINYKKKTYALFDGSFSEINLDSHYEKVIAKIKTLSDVELIKDSLYVSSEEAGMFVLKKNKLRAIPNLRFKIHEINLHNNLIYLSCADGLRILNLKYEVIQFIPFYKAIKSLVTDLGIFVSTYRGLYLVDIQKNKIFELVSGVEFNKKALETSDNYLLAGSIQGVYVIDLVELKTNYINNLNSFAINEDSHSNTSFIFMIICALLVILSLYLYYSKQKTITLLATKKQSFESEESLYKVIQNNPSIKSVEDLANHIGISSPTLITKVKEKTGLSPLQFMKKCKTTIALEMVAAGIPVDEIAVRLGYSVRFVKSNFLKNKQ